MNSRWTRLGPDISHRLLQNLRFDQKKNSKRLDAVLRRRACLGIEPVCEEADRVRCPCFASLQLLHILKTLYQWCRSFIMCCIGCFILELSRRLTSLAHSLPPRHILILCSSLVLQSLLDTSSSSRWLFGTMRCPGSSRYHLGELTLDCFVERRTLTCQAMQSTTFPRGWSFTCCSSTSRMPPPAPLCQVYLAVVRHEGSSGKQRRGSFGR